MKPRLLAILFSLIAATTVAAPGTEQTSNQTEGAETTAQKAPAIISLDQIHSITYQVGDKEVTRYFKLVEGRFKHLHLIEVDGLTGTVIEMPVLRRISPNAIPREGDEKNIQPSADMSPETWMLRTMGFFFAQLTARQDAPTRPELITCANGLSYRYFGLAPYMKDVVKITGPNGEKALSVRVYDKTKDGYVVSRETSIAKADPVAEPKQQATK